MSGSKETFSEYFKRLKIQPGPPSLDLVSELQQKHLAQLCFSSIAVLLKKTISLGISDIISKVVIQNQGGYCFEHNKLMHDVLHFLGFEVRLLIAKVIHNQGIDTPRTHRITLLEWLGDLYLVDAGFGPNCPRLPIKIEEGSLSVQKGASYRLVLNSIQDYQLELMSGKGFLPLYTFNLHHYTEADCVMGNFYSSRHPNAVFVNNLVVSRILPEVTLSLRNKTYHRIKANNTEAFSIDDPFQLQDIIKNDFNISLSDDDCRILYESTPND